MVEMRCRRLFQLYVLAIATRLSTSRPNDLEEKDRRPTTPWPLSSATTDNVSNTSQRGKCRRGGSTESYDHLHCQCLNIKDKSVRAACFRVAKNPIVRSMGNGTKGFIGLSEYVTSRGFRVLGGPTVQSICGDLYCPEEKMGRRLQADDNLSSLSPWKFCSEFDPLRYPQWIIKAKCLCIGCLHPLTGRQILESVVSREVFVEINVLRKSSINVPFSDCNPNTCKEVVQRIPIGCHCSLAAIISG